MEQLELDSGSLVGAQFGNYRAEKLLGSGSMGEVYLGVHPEIAREVAIKVMAADIAEHPAMQSRFLEEARALSRIKHPNVIEIYDFGRLPSGQPYYVMELLSGRPLSDEMARVGQFSASDLLPMLQQICRGLQVVHQQGIVHRDLKPENIFLLESTPLQVKLLDFGLAKVLPSERRRTGRGVILGSPTVIAPEQVAGQAGQIGPRTDLYSLGVVLFWMLAGSPPFDDEAPALLLARHLDDPAPDLATRVPEVPAGIARLVARCLAKRPEGRPASAAEVAELFERGLREGQEAEAASIHLVSSSARIAPSSRRWRLWGAASAILLAGALGAWLLGSRREAAPGGRVRAASTPAAASSLAADASPLRGPRAPAAGADASDLMLSTVEPQHRRVGEEKRTRAGRGTRAPATRDGGGIGADQRDNPPAPRSRAPREVGEGTLDPAELPASR